MQKRYALLCTLFGALSAGCYPGEIDTAAQTDIVATFHMEGADYTANHTYDMPDSVVAVGGLDTLDHSHDAAVLAKVAAEMAAMGYTRVDATVTKPDVVILVSAISVDNYDVWYSYPWWPYWGWWGGWDGYWPYGVNSTYYYPWYPVTVTGYTTGSLFIQMIDPDVVPIDSTQATPIWLAAINGLLEGTQIGTRVDNSITQAFAQSPYLHTQ
jgi:hypothetical protein